jgi:hypothetical protein
MLDEIEDHVREFFEEHPLRVKTWADERIAAVQPDFRVVEAGPGPRSSLWTYTSIGAATLHEPALEFCLLVERPGDWVVETLAMVVHYHRFQKLGLGHTFPLGDPWHETSLCDHMLVSLPYPLGPKFEVCARENAHAHIFWLLPITKSEKDFKVSNGVEALEQLFEKAGLDFWNLSRDPVV